MARVVWCSAHSCSDLQQATWFLVATGVLEALTEQHWQPKNLLDTRSAVSAKLKLSQLSTLQRRHSSLIWPFAKMDAVMKERILFFPQCNTSKINLCPHNWRSKAPNSSMEFCCSRFRVQMHNPLVHDSPCPFIYHQGTEASLLELRRFMTLGSGLGFPDSPNTTGQWYLEGLAPMDQLSKSRTKNNLQAKYRTPQMPLAARHWFSKGSKSKSQ